MKREQIIRAIEGSRDAPAAFLKLLEKHVRRNFHSAAHSVASLSLSVYKIGEYRRRLGPERILPGSAAEAARARVERSAGASAGRLADTG